MFASAQLPLALPGRSKLKGRLPAGTLLLVPLLGVVTLVIKFPHLLPKTSELQARRGHMDGWMECHRQLADEMQTACRAGVPAFDVLWYGDSITEMFREEERGRPCGQRCESVSNVWGMHYARYNNGAYGIAGDTTEHLLWRLGHGESPGCPGAHAIVVLIGTNDLGIAAWRAGPSGAAQAVHEATHVASSGVQQVCGALRRMAPAAHIVVLGILPRGLTDKSDPSSPIIYHDQPSMFSQPIKNINLELSAFAGSESGMTYVDCGGLFLLPGGDLNSELMPDALHPSAKGMEVLLSCVDVHLLPLLNGQPRLNK